MICLQEMSNLIDDFRATEILTAIQNGDIVTLMEIPYVDANEMMFALSIAVDIGHVLMVSELTRVFFSKKFTIDDDFFYNGRKFIDICTTPSFENVGLVPVRDIPQIDENNLVDPTTVMARTVIIFNLVYPKDPILSNLPRFDDDTECFDIAMYETTSVGSFLVNEQNEVDLSAGFIFIETGQQPVCYSRAGLKSILTNTASQVYNCLDADNNMFPNDHSKSQRKLGLQPIVLIGNTIGHWFVFKASLYNVLIRFKSAIIYLEPAWKIKWRINEDLRFFRRGAEAISNQHCQDTDSQTVYALAIDESRTISSNENYNLFSQQDIELFEPDYNRNVIQNNLQEASVFVEEPEEIFEDFENDQSASDLERLGRVFYILNMSSNQDESVPELSPHLRQIAAEVVSEFQRIRANFEQNGLDTSPSNIYVEMLRQNIETSADGSLDGRIADQEIVIRNLNEESHSEMRDFTIRYFKLDAAIHNAIIWDRVSDDLIPQNIPSNSSLHVLENNRNFLNRINFVSWSIMTDEAWHVEFQSQFSIFKEIMRKIKTVNLERGKGVVAKIITDIVQDKISVNSIADQFFAYVFPKQNFSLSNETKALLNSTATSVEGIAATAAILKIMGDDFETFAKANNEYAFKTMIFCVVKGLVRLNGIKLINLGFVLGLCLDNLHGQNIINSASNQSFDWLTDPFPNRDLFKIWYQNLSPNSPNIFFPLTSPVPFGAATLFQAEFSFRTSQR